jgi:hypothetical protein
MSRSVVKRCSKSAERSHVRRWAVGKANDARKMSTADDYCIALPREAGDRVIEKGAPFEFRQGLVASESA